MILLFATIITLTAAASKSIETDKLPINNDAICETQACVHAASFILKNMNTNVDPCDNFYQFACGKFVEDTIIPDTKETVGTLENLDDEIKKQLHLLLLDKLKKNNSTDSDDSVLSSMKTYYRSCMDTDKIEENSEKELREDLKVLGGCPILEGQYWNEANFDWKISMYNANKMGYNTNLFFEISSEADPDNSSRNILEIDSPNTELPYESLIDGKDNEVVQGFMQMVLKIFKVLGVDKKQAEKVVDSVVDFDIALAKISMPKEDRRNASNRNNRMTLQQLETRYTGISWTEFFNEILAPYAHVDQDEEIIVADPNFLRSLPNLIEKTPKRVLANYICVRTISQTIEFMGKELSSIVHEGNIEFGGAEVQKQRKEVCFKNLYQWFYPAIGRLYVKDYSHINAKNEATNIVYNLRDYLHHMIEQTDWMDEETKLMALKKLNTMKSSVGYPVELENDKNVNEYYRTLKLYSKSFLRSELTLNQLSRKRIFSRLRKPVNQFDWITYSDIVQANAVYYFSKNSFALPAGILQGHFYDSNRPNYINYGAIGSIIGHEMSHAFDDEGSQYDEKGNLFNWWKNETRQKYLKKTECIVKQYSKYIVKEVNKTVDGDDSQGENIADNVGLKASYLAYIEWSKRNSKEFRLPGLRYTPQQMFWINFANNFCSKSLLKKLKIDLDFDPHPPMEFRVIGAVSNMPEFSQDFKCPLNSPMNPAKKCSFW
ncbi:neprilysin-2-like [Phymastichus coffea]|uniref:neprilysin-2-like n=1 Tax=Phymastichus coffea TaxID=108790 RepID=UPI00273C8C2A|nr:neprilysin-2-like [Phymastichus coffea]